MSWPSRTVRIGPAAFHLRAPYRDVLAEVALLYRDYPDATADGIYDYCVSAVPHSPLRRFIRPSIGLACDFEPFETLPLPKRLGLLALEMGMNLQMAIGHRQHIVVHAASSAIGEKAALIIGDSGAGKSTMAAALAYREGWRHLGDEFALLDLERPRLHPFPRPISLKNESIAAMQRLAPAERFGPRLEGTVKGTIRHLLPPVAAIGAMDVPADVALLVAPRFEPGATPAWRPMTRTETYVRLAASSTNQATMGEAGFDAIWRCFAAVPAFDIVYGSTDDGLDLFLRLWRRATA
jgi:HprK-related kinase A